MSHSPRVSLAPGPLSPGRAAAPAAFPTSSTRGASSRASHRARRRHEGLPESRRDPATSPQDGGRHHRDSPRRAPSPTRKTRRMGPDPGDLSRRGVRRRSAQARTGTPPGNWRRGGGRCWNVGGALRACASAQRGQRRWGRPGRVRPHAVAPPTSRLRLAARVAQSVAGERLRGDPLNGCRAGSVEPRGWWSGRSLSGRIVWGRPRRHARCRRRSVMPVASLTRDRLLR